LTSYPVDLCYAPTVNEVFCATELGRVVAIDCRADTVVGTVTVWEEPVRLCAAPAESKVYCGMYSSERSAVAVIDCSTHSVVDSLYVIDIDITDMAYNPAANKLYVAWGRFGSVIIVDCANDSVLAWVDVGEGEGKLAVDATDNKVYVAGDRDERVDVISGATNTVVARIDSVDVRDLVWDGADNVVFGLDRYGHQMVAIDCRADTLLGFTSVPGHPGSLCWNPVQNRVYVTVDDDIAVADPVTRRLIDRVPLWFDMGRLCLYPERNLLYAAGRNVVAVIELPANRVREFIPVPAAARSFHAHSARQKVYCATDSGVVVLDATGDSVLSVVPGTGRTRMVCHNQARDVLYAACGDTVRVLDCTGDTVIASIRFSHHGVDTMAYSPGSNRLFCSLYSPGQVAAVDGSGDSIIEYLPLPDDDHALCYIADGDLLAVSNRNRHSVFLIDCASGTLLAMTQLYYEPYALAHSAHSRKLYSFEYTARHVTVIDVSTMRVRGQMWLTGEVESQNYDSLADRVVLGLEQTADEVRFIDCRLDSFVGAVFIPGTPISMVKGLDRRLYVSNQYASSYSVIRDTTTVGTSETMNDERGMMGANTTIVRSLLFLPEAVGGERLAAGAHLLDATGRKVADLHAGANDVRTLAPGIYFVRSASSVMRDASSEERTSKVVITR
jgi:DNA-binding beta-propeller fold protein YncE